MAFIERTWAGHTASLAAVLCLWLGVLAPAPAAESEIRLVDVTEKSGISFMHTIGDDKMTNIVESTGVGCALLDYDGDGWLDVYLVNGRYLKGLSDSNVADPLKLSLATDRLFHNRGDGTFEDVTRAMGILPGGYGMGVTVGDFDNDGWRDLYVTNYGPNRLYHNTKGRSFEEVAERMGVAGGDRFSVGATFLDFDGDTFLDLFVGNYLTYVPGHETAGTFPGPTAYEGQVNRLYRNLGNGTFQDVTAHAQLEDFPGHTMGVGAFDYNNDGRLDLFVANDAMENFFFENQGDGTFVENALLANVAYGANGDARGAMGAEIGDLDGDGLFDLFVPDFTHTCLYTNLGDGFFEDQARRSGLAVPCGHYISWGAVLVDLDLDTDLDIYVANGEARQLVAHPDLVFENNGAGWFNEISKDCGVKDLTPRVSRGVAAGDIDNDGDLDLLVVHLNDRPVLLRNDSARRGRHWLMVHLIANTELANRDAVGAIVRCKFTDPTGKPRTVIRQRTSSGSYMCAHDPRLHFGLGSSDAVSELEITWPDRSVQTLHRIPADQVLTVRQASQ